jgi:thiol-disulfide isomerase/thioredoxin
MTRIARATVCIWTVVASFVPVTCFAEAPSVEDVLKICRENREKLNPLHVRATHIEERTDAYAKARQQDALGIETILKTLDKGESIPELEKQMPGISSPKYKEILRQQVKNSQALAASVRFEHKYEFFIDHDNYQVRSAAAPSEEDWSFPDAPLSADALKKDFAQTRIYSRVVGRTPPAQIWPGEPSPDSEPSVMITAKHINETQHMRFPPFMQALHPQIYYVHPIDMFFSAPADRYRVVGQEKKDGRLLTIVDVLVPSEQTGSKIGPDGKPQQYKMAYWLRGWLDLDRGGIPVVLQFWYGADGEGFDEHFRTVPSRVTTTTEIKLLANGAYYPAHTVEEEFNGDPDTPTLNEVQWAEVRAGTRNPPPNVVHERYTWDCTTVDARPVGGEDFFVLKFPEGQKYFDLDAGKVIGALANTPAIKAGEPAPAWKVARWLDGKQHSLEEFRGKVVVLHFWGLWCSACRNSVPALVAVQEKFKDKPVVFVSVHTAESDCDKLVARIEKFASEQGWHYLAAIDAGTMIEDSATSHAYGCNGFPTEVIIGPDGRVSYTSAVSPPGMEGIFGKACDQITTDDQVKIDAFEKAMFEAAGEKWPLAKDLSEEELKAVMNRISVFQTSQQIAEALSRGERQQK